MRNAISLVFADEAVNRAIAEAGPPGGAARKLIGYILPTDVYVSEIAHAFAGRRRVRPFMARRSRSSALQSHSRPGCHPRRHCSGRKNHPGGGRQQDTDHRSACRSPDQLDLRQGSLRPPRHSTAACLFRCIDRDASGYAALARTAHALALNRIDPSAWRGKSWSSFVAQTLQGVRIEAGAIAGRRARPQGEWPPVVLEVAEHRRHFDWRAFGEWRSPRPALFLPVHRACRMQSGGLRRGQAPGDRAPPPRSRRRAETRGRRRHSPRHRNRSFRRGEPRGSSPPAPCPGPR